MRSPCSVLVRGGKKDTGLATTIKLGGWGHFGQSNDIRFGVGGSLLANPLVSATPLQHRGNSGLYAVVDQQLYRPKDGDSQSGVSAYVRASISPSDRNLVDRYIDAGIVFAGLMPQRKDDRFGVGVIHTKFSDSVRALDRDQNLFGLPGAVRDSETNLEFSYVAQVIPGWIVQPLITRVWHPNGDPSKNAVVTGVRSR